MSDLFQYDRSKTAATTGQAVAVGAGGGALVGALSTLFDENPNLRQLAKNVLIGSAGGAAIGGGVQAMRGAEDDMVAPTPPSSSPASPMSLPVAALSGLIPGLGPAIHSVAANPDLGGVAQAAGSGAASLAASYPILGAAAQKAKATGTVIPGKTQALGAGASVLAALAAAAIGNKVRGSETEKVAASRLNLYGGLAKEASSLVDYNDKLRRAITSAARKRDDKDQLLKNGGPIVGSCGHQIRPGNLEPLTVGVRCKTCENASDVVKSAARLVRKTEMVEEHHDHCPHCDHEFIEKSYPVMQGLPEDEQKRKEAIEAGDYDEHCPSCGGIIDQDEMTDAEIEKHVTTGFFAQDPEFAAKLKQQYITRRDNQKRRREEREKSASRINESVKEDHLITMRIMSMGAELEKGAARP